MVEERCPHEQAAGGLGLGRHLREGFNEHFGVELPDEISSTRRSRAARARALRRAPRCVYAEREKELGIELLLRVFRHFYLEEIDQRVGRAPHQHGAPARRHRPARLRPARSEAGVQEGGLRPLRQHDGGDELATSSTKLMRGAGSRRRARSSASSARTTSATSAQRSRCSSATAARSPRATRRSGRAPPPPPRAAARVVAPVAARGAEDRPQRSLPVRQRQEVQEVPRRRPRGRGQRRRPALIAGRDSGTES